MSEHWTEVPTASSLDRNNFNLLRQQKHHYYGVPSFVWAAVLQEGERRKKIETPRDVPSFLSSVRRRTAQLYARLSGEEAGRSFRSITAECRESKQSDGSGESLDESTGVDNQGS